MNSIAECTIPDCKVVSIIKRGLCHRHYYRWVKAHKTLGFIKQQNKLKDRYRKNRIYYIKKLGGRCITCGTKDKLEFDHINPSEKENNVGRLLNKANNELIEKEINKCQLLCRKCHLVKTKKDQYASGRWSTTPNHGIVSTYSNHKCRCNLCRKVWSDYQKLYKQRKRALMIMALVL